MLDGHLNRGGFLSTSDTNIVIRRRAGDMTFTKDQIRKVSVRKAGKRWRNAAIGAGIGAAASVGVTMTTGSSDHVDRFVFVAAVSAMVGTGIGALVPGYDTLYRAPRK